MHPIVQSPVLAAEDTGAFFAEERATHHSPAIVAHGNAIPAQRLTRHRSTGIGLLPSPTLSPHERHDGTGDPSFIGPPIVDDGSAQGSGGLPPPTPTFYETTHPGFILPGQRDFRNDPWAIAKRIAGLAKKRATPLPPGGREWDGSSYPGPNDYAWDSGYGWRNDFEPGGTPTNPGALAHIRGET